MTGGGVLGLGVSDSVLPPASSASSAWSGAPEISAKYVFMKNRASWGKGKRDYQKMTLFTQFNVSKYTNHHINDIYGI